MPKETKWKIDPAHSEIAFKARHLMISNVKGVFRKYEAIVHARGKNFLIAKVEVSIDADSIETYDAKRDKRLRGEEFFDAGKFSKITFKGGTVGKGKDDEHYELAGDLTIKGISKPVSLSVKFGGIAKDTRGNEKAGFTVTGTVNRKDWDLNWNAVIENGVVLSDEIKIICETEFFRVDEADAGVLEASEEKELIAE